MRDPFADAPLSDAAFADYAAIEPMYVDGVAGVFNLGANFGTMFFRWTPVRSEDGPVMFERSPGLVLVQPRSALLCGKSCRLNAIHKMRKGVPTRSWCHASLLVQLSTNHCVSTISKPYAGERQACRRFAFRSRQAMRLFLLAYATIVILLGWWPWHILLLALIASSESQAVQNCETCGTRPLITEANHHIFG